MSGTKTHMLCGKAVTLGPDTLQLSVSGLGDSISLSFDPKHTSYKAIKDLFGINKRGFKAFDDQNALTFLRDNAEELAYLLDSEPAYFFIENIARKAAEYFVQDKVEEFKKDGLCFALSALNVSAGIGVSVK